MALRELDERTGDGIRVVLFWEETENKVFCLLEDHKQNTNSQFEVPADKAMDAFMHPFAFLPKEN